jgi:putative SOS response-associated peptidase YedK
MCNHYRNIPGARKYLRTWKQFAGFDLPGELPDVAFEMHPRRSGLVLRIEDGSVKADVMMWGLHRQVPGSRPGTIIAKHATNVRNLASPVWRSMLKNPDRRCPVPFTSFAEPVAGGERAEHWFKLLDRPLAAFAGIWRTTVDGKAFAILTCEPNALVEPLAKAMPVILAEGNYREWLTGDWSDAERLAVPYPPELMEVEGPAI